MKYERRASIAVLVALVVTALSAFPGLSLAAGFLFFILLLVALVLLALPSGVGTLGPLRRSRSMWLACALMAGSLIVSPHWRVIEITLRTLGVVAFIEALAAARGRQATATSPTKPPSP